MELKSAESVLKEQGIYFGQEVIAGIPCTIGYEKVFKWSWMATQLNTFVIVGTTDEPIDKARIEYFSKACFDYAVKNNQGWPRGLQSGIGSIAILQANNIDAGAAAFCEHPSKKHFSAFEIPILYQRSEKRTIRYIKRPIWGTIYFPYFTQLIDKITSSF